jgi:molybdate transport system permease protein
VTLDLAPFRVSASLALVTTLVLLAVCLPLLRWRLSIAGPWVGLLESCLMLTMVLPPTVVGFYFLRLLSPAAPLGRAIEGIFGARLLFTFPGLVLASCVVCFPFMYQALKASMLAIDPRVIESSYVLGKGRAETFFRVIIPHMTPGILSAVLLTFAHAVGEFGVALMVGGSVAGKTKTASIALYEFVESSRYAEAGAYALAILAFSWLCIAALTLSGTRRARILP